MAKLFHSFLLRTTYDDFSMCVMEIMMAFEKANIDEPLVLSVYKILKSKQDKIDQIKITSRSHKLSKVIQRDVKLREKRISSVRLGIRSKLASLKAEQREAAEHLTEWLSVYQKYFSRRELLAVTKVILNLEKDYQSSEQIRHELALLDQVDMFENLCELNNQIRANNMARLEDKRSKRGKLKALRAEIYADVTQLFHILSVCSKLNLPQKAKFVQLCESIQNTLTATRRKMEARRRMLRRRKKRQEEAVHMALVPTIMAVGETPLPIAFVADEERVAEPHTPEGQKNADPYGGTYFISQPLGVLHTLKTDKSGHLMHTYMKNNLVALSHEKPPQHFNGTTTFSVPKKRKRFRKVRTENR